MTVRGHGAASALQDLAVSHYLQRPVRTLRQAVQDLRTRLRKQCGQPEAIRCFDCGQCCAACPLLHRDCGSVCDGVG